MKRLLLLLPLVCCINTRPAHATDWAIWLAHTYCEARQSGFDNGRAVEMMFYEGNNGYEHIRIPWQKAMRQNRSLAKDMIAMEIDKRRDLGICG